MLHGSWHSTMFCVVTFMKQMVIIVGKTFCHFTYKLVVLCWKENTCKVTAFTKGIQSLGTGWVEEGA